MASYRFSVLKMDGFYFEIERKFPKENTFSITPMTSSFDTFPYHIRKINK